MLHDAVPEVVAVRLRKVVSSLSGSGVGGHVHGQAHVAEGHVEIDDQDVVCGILGEGSGKVDGDGRLADAALLADDGDDAPGAAGQSGLRRSGGPEGTDDLHNLGLLQRRLDQELRTGAHHLLEHGHPGRGGDRDDRRVGQASAQVFDRPDRSRERVLKGDEDDARVVHDDFAEILHAGAAAQADRHASLGERASQLLAGAGIVINYNCCQCAIQLTFDLSVSRPISSW